MHPSLKQYDIKIMLLLLLCFCDACGMIHQVRSLLVVAKVIRLLLVMLAPQVSCPLTDVPPAAP